MAWTLDRDSFATGEIWSRRFAGDGSPLGAGQRVGAADSGSVALGNVARDPSGGSLVTWYDTLVGDGDGRGVFGRRRSRR